MIRSCIIPNVEFNDLDSDIVHSACKEFYELYESLFGVLNCPYYVHVLTSHLLKIRGKNPLTFNSAFGFESFYGEVRKAFVPGTPSPLKQILKNVMMKRVLGSHNCKLSIKYTVKNTPKECNNLIYTYKNSKYQFYQIKANQEDKLFECQEINTNIKEFTEKNLPWHRIGVFEKGDGFGETIFIHLDKIAGKVIEVEKLLITCPLNILREK